MQPAPAVPEIRPDIPGTVTVERFEFEGNTAFSAEELGDLLKPFTGKPITFSELLQAEAARSRVALAPLPAATPKTPEPVVRQIRAFLEFPRTWVEVQNS